MPKSPQKTKEFQYSVKVQDFIKMLQLLEKLYQSPLGMNPHMTSFIKKLSIVLSPYKELSENEFFEMLKTSLPTYETKRAKITKKRALNSVDVGNISFEELRALFSKKGLTKEELLLIGEQQFGISKGTHRRLKKEQLQDLIESAMQNVETLHIIKDKA